MNLTEIWVIDEQKNRLARIVPGPNGTVRTFVGGDGSGSRASRRASRPTRFPYRFTNPSQEGGGIATAERPRMVPADSDVAPLTFGCNCCGTTSCTCPPSGATVPHVLHATITGTDSLTVELVWDPSFSGWWGSFSSACGQTMCIFIFCHSSSPTKPFGVIFCCSAGHPNADCQTDFSAPSPVTTWTCSPVQMHFTGNYSADPSCINCNPPCTNLGVPPAIWHVPLVTA
jgi:hypothetical protein